MPVQKRFKTTYPGVSFIEGIGADGKPERIFMIRYRKAGKQVEEKAGRARQDDMTPAKAARMRALRITGDLSNNERREKEERIKKEAEARPTISKLWKVYKEVKTIKGLRTDENRFQIHLKTVFGDKEPKDILPLDVDRLRISLSKNRTPQTVAHVLELLRRIINFGVEKGLCEPIKFKIKLPMVDNVVTEFLTPAELERLIAVLDTYPDIQAANLIRLAMFTGMRRGELFRLKWTDIDFDNRFINLTGTKGGRDQRIPLNQNAVDVLKNHPQTESEFVFPGRFGGQRKTIQKEANKIKAAADLPESFRPLHGYRHTFASMLASSGKVDMFTLQKILTHKSPAMTQRYAHLRDETLAAAAGVVDDIFTEMKLADVDQIQKKGGE